ncbi:hypothetical protein Tco_0314538, partial [Tanacetum coccineum]
MHQEDQQAAGGPTSLGATSKEGSHPQLSSGMSALILIKPVYSASFIFTLSLHQDVMFQWIPQLKLILENMLLMISYLNNRMEDLSNLMYDTRSDFISTEMSASLLQMKVKRRKLKDMKTL